MRNVLLCALCAILGSSCHPQFVTLKKHHAKRIHGTKQIMMVPERADVLRFNGSHIHITSERDGYTHFAANPGATGKGYIKKTAKGGFEKYRYKLVKNPVRK